MNILDVMRIVTELNKKKTLHWYGAWPGLQTVKYMSTLISVSDCCLTFNKVGIFSYIMARPAWRDWNQIPIVYI